MGVAAEAPPSALTAVVGAAQAAELWAIRPRGATADDQAARLELLCSASGPLAHDPAAFAAPCLRRAPRIFVAPLPTLRESAEALRDLLDGSGNSSPQPKLLSTAVAHNPRLLLASAADLWLAAEALVGATGLTRRQLARVLRTAPGLLLRPTAETQANIAWLRARLDIDGGRLRRVITHAPLALLANPDRTMQPRLRRLEGLGLSADTLRTVVVRTPALLHSDTQLIDDRVRWLRDHHVLERLDEIGATGASPLGEWLGRPSGQGDFFSLSLRRLDSVWSWLTAGLKLSEAQAAAVLAAEPAICSLPLAQMRDRASFFLGVLKGSTDELAALPHALTGDLVRVLVLRYAFCLLHGLAPTPAVLLTKGDAQFVEAARREELELAGGQASWCTLEALRDFESEGKHLSFFQGADL